MTQGQESVLGGGLVVAAGVVLESNPGWFAGASTVGLILVVFGAVCAGLGLLRSL